MDKKKVIAQCELIDDINNFVLASWIETNRNELKYCKYSIHETYYKARISAYERTMRYLTNRKIQLRMNLLKQEKERGTKNESRNKR